MGFMDQGVDDEGIFFVGGRTTDIYTMFRGGVLGVGGVRLARRGWQVSDCGVVRVDDIAIRWVKQSGGLVRERCC